MSTNQTTNYELNQWLSTDQVLRTDFNADNAKLDAALQALTDTTAGKADAGELSALSATVVGQAAQIAQKGNCRIVYGTYTGNGGYGSSSPNTLTFDAKPIFVYVVPQNRDSYHDVHLKLFRNVTYAISLDGNSSYVNATVWSGNIVQWYSISAVNTGEMQLNMANAVYAYIALLAAEE